jgi:hypothetical protein
MDEEHTFIDPPTLCSTDSPSIWGVSVNGFAGA